MVSVVSGRRLANVTTISITFLLSSPITLIITKSLFSSWVSVAYFVPAAIGWSLLGITLLINLCLFIRERDRGGSLGVPDWTPLVAASCTLCTIGLLMTIASFCVLLAAAIQTRSSITILSFIITAIIITLSSIIFTCVNAVRALTDDDGDDVVEFDVSNDRSKTSQDKDDKYWSAEDNDEIADSGNGLQY